MPIPNALPALITERLHPGGRPGTADDAIALWQSMFAKFRPLLGPLSTDLLFVRTLFGHSREFPWLGELAGLDGSHDAREAFGAFVDRMYGRAPEEIVAVNHRLLTAYAAEIVDLIGERLATRFLHAALAPADAPKNI